MEEQKQISAQGGNGEKKEGGKGRSGRRHHHNRHNRHKGGNQAQKPLQEGVEQVSAKPATDNAPKKQAPQKNQQNHEQSNKQENKQRNGKRHRNDRNRKKRDGGQQGAPKPLYSPEEVSPAEPSLEELRSRIVLNPATPSLSSTSILDRKATDASPLPEIASLENYPPVDEIANLSKKEDGEERVEVVGVRFRASGKMYYFDPQGIQAKKGECGIVETARGPEFGDICLGNTTVPKSHTVSPLRPLLRVATPADIAHNEENRKKEKEALSVCQERVAAHKLEMKLIDVQYSFDNSKLLFYFTADGRVDFRDLVKDLASIFRTRIELRQIGIRDEAKMLGGIGACGRMLCCSTFLPDFAQVSIKMAKEQNLSLNSSKISGVCGRLMCCLRFESDVYSEEIKLTPPVDSVVKTEDGIGYVISTNPLAGTVRVVLKDTPDVAPKQYHRSTVTILERDRKHKDEKGKHGEEA